VAVSFIGGGHADDNEQKTNKGQTHLEYLSRLKIKFKTLKYLNLQIISRNICQNTEVCYLSAKNNAQHCLKNSIGCT
jgi:hypothetical protein